MSAWAQLEQILTCAICLDKFKNPKLLPCQHTFCGDACMEGLVDYARRQIKCPECRAEHRIPYQGVSSLPPNVTLIRFLELHSKITGDEPEPTFLDKCAICGEKIEGVARCAHCDKKACAECRESHIDIMRRDIVRVNGQSRRCLSKMHELSESLAKCRERLAGCVDVARREIESNAKRVVDDIEARRKRLLAELDEYEASEQKTIDTMNEALCSELEIFEDNSSFADKKIATSDTSQSRFASSNTSAANNTKLAWSDAELAEFKSMYARSYEFVRLFDVELGDASRKVRFSLVADFDAMRKRVCELGDLKLGEPLVVTLANALNVCGAGAGHVARELCTRAATHLAAQGAVLGGGASNNLLLLQHSSSNSNLGVGMAGASQLQLPSSNISGLMLNSLARSQSDHRLATQFQQRLKAAAAAGGADLDANESAIRSRYAPPPSRYNDEMTSKLTRDWPRPGDSEFDSASSLATSGSHFKSAYLRRKAAAAASDKASVYRNNDDDDLDSTYADYQATDSSRLTNFRYSDVGLPQLQTDQQQQTSLIFNPKDAASTETGPLSGVPRLSTAPYVVARVHAIGAKSAVDERRAREEAARDQELAESARVAMQQATARQAAMRKQKEAAERADAEAVAGRNGTEAAAHGSGGNSRHASPEPRAPSPQTAPAQLQQQPASGTLTQAPTKSTSATPTSTTPSTHSTEPVPSSSTSCPPNRAPQDLRRSLYGAAVTERSRRAAETSTRRRNSHQSTTADESTDTAATAPTSGASTPSSTTSRRRRLVRGDSSPLASVGSTPPLVRRRPQQHSSTMSSTTTAPSDDESTASRADSSTATRLSRRLKSSRQASLASTATTAQSSLDNDSELTATAATNDDNVNDNDRDDSEADLATAATTSRVAGSKRKSAEFLPSAVNRLLDRSAQIRRDSQEQRVANPSSAVSSSASPYYATSRYGLSSRAENRRYAGYARSSTNNESLDDDDENLTVATSPAVTNSELASSRSRRLSSTDTSADTNDGYQSRFLARSRTAAALASLSGSGSSSSRYAEDYDAAGSSAASRRQTAAASTKISTPTTSSTSTSLAGKSPTTSFTLRDASSSNTRTSGRHRGGSGSTSGFSLPQWRSLFRHQS